MMRSSLPASQTFPSTAFQNGSIVGLSDDTAQPFHVLSTTASSLYASLLQAIDGVITFHIPFTKTKTFGQRLFSFTGPTQWNSLPYDVRHSASTSSFKQALKTHLFKSAYN